MSRKQPDAPLEIVLEVDVGLRRGGFSSAEQMAEALVWLSNEETHGVTVCGIMGYDAHASMHPWQADTTHCTKLLYRFADALHQNASHVTSKSMTINSGGSQTFHCYAQQTANAASAPNELSLGTAFLCSTASMQPSPTPALLIATPILKVIQGPCCSALACDSWKLLHRCLQLHLFCRPRRMGCNVAIPCRPSGPLSAVLFICQQLDGKCQNDYARVHIIFV